MNVIERFSLSDRVAIVTGAGRGIGRGLAVGMADAGAGVCVVDLDAITANETAQNIQDNGGRAIAVPCDVTDDDAQRRAVEAATSGLGVPTILVNNAGMFSPGTPAENVSMEEWRRVMRLNVDAMFFLSQKVARGMIKAGVGGAIINTSSQSGIIYTKGSPKTSYCTSKAAVIMLTRSLAMEWARYNIRVNAIAPGYVATPGIAGSLSDPVRRKHREENTPIGRLGTPEDLAGAVVFLASDASSFVTGATLVIDGGFSSQV